MKTMSNSRGGSFIKTCFIAKAPAALRISSGSPARKKKQNEASQDLLFACVAFMVLLFFALANNTFRI